MRSLKFVKTNLSCVTSSFIFETKSNRRFVNSHSKLYKIIKSENTYFHNHLKFCYHYKLYLKKCKNLTGEMP